MTDSWNDALQVFQDNVCATSSHILVRLQDAAEAFLQESYGRLMPVVQKELAPGLGVSSLSRDDFLHYLRLTHFFVRYVCLKLVCERVCLVQGCIGQCSFPSHLSLVRTDVGVYA